MRWHRYRMTERINNAGADPGFAPEQSAGDVKSLTLVSVGVNWKAHFAQLKGQQPLLPCSASRSVW